MPKRKMARIIYGINGEGLGHATRSKPIIQALSRKHELKIFAGRRAYDYLVKEFNAEKIYAFDIIYSKNAVAIFRTFIKNILLFPFFGISSIVRIFLAMKEFKPDIVISDFEPLTHFVAHLMGVKIISIDNQHILTNCKITFNNKFFLDYLASKIVAILFTGHSDHYLITSFFYPPIKKKNTELVAPLIREKILGLKPKKGNHIIVYQTSRSYATLIPVLKEFKDEEFRIYKADKEGREGNVVFKGFKEEEFLKDLASCKAVITNGGFTLMSEAIYLDKPVLSVPVKKQFEQILNGIHLSQAGFGEHHQDINREVLSEFIKNIPKYRKKLHRHHEVGNKKVIDIIEEIIADSFIRK
jgi:uncharacterized protein (TIGR00661 family)